MCGKELVWKNSEEYKNLVLEFLQHANHKTLICGIVATLYLKIKKKQHLKFMSRIA